MDENRDDSGSESDYSEASMELMDELEIPYDPTNETDDEEGMDDLEFTDADGMASMMSTGKCLNRVKMSD